MLLISIIIIVIIIIIIIMHSELNECACIHTLRFTIIHITK